MSSNLSEVNHQNAKLFLKPIEDITERFVGQTDELINDPVYGLTGGLTTISPTESYKLKVTENHANIWSGNGSKPETTTVNLHKGWNWIGYVPVSINTLSAALAGITPAENDVIKCMDDFATYTGGKWVGTLTQLKPGEGYLYYAANATTFHYPVQRVFPVALENDAKTNVSMTLEPWHYDIHQYPDNTTLIGRVYTDNLPSFGGTYTIGAFCGTECRGVGRYVDDVLFLTIHGTLSEGQRITFKAYENATGTEYDIAEHLVFKGQQAGTYNAPIALHVNNTTAIRDVEAQKYSVYPNPLRSRMYVNGDTEQIKSIQILSMNGAVCVSQNGYTDEGVDVSGLSSGVYVVAITPQKGKIYYEKVIKARN